MRLATFVNSGTVVDENGDVGSPFSIVGAGEMDGDGNAGEIQIWFMDGHRILRRNRVRGRSVTIGPWSIVGTGDGTVMPPIPAQAHRFEDNQCGRSRNQYFLE
jgi:hypothetical protein